jgi:L-asparagine transporter-like permease
VTYTLETHSMRRMHTIQLLPTNIMLSYYLVFPTRPDAYGLIDKRHVNLPPLLFPTWGSSWAPSLSTNPGEVTFTAHMLLDHGTLPGPWALSVIRTVRARSNSADEDVENMEIAILPFSEDLKLLILEVVFKSSFYMPENNWHISIYPSIICPSVYLSTYLS